MYLLISHFTHRHVIYQSMKYEKSCKWRDDTEKSLFCLIIQLELTRIYTGLLWSWLTWIKSKLQPSPTDIPTHFRTMVSEMAFASRIFVTSAADWTRRIDLIPTPVQRPGYSEGARRHPSIPSASPPIWDDDTDTVKHKKQSFKTSREHHSTAEKQSEPRLCHENKQPDSVICWVVRVDFNYWKI